MVSTHLKNISEIESFPQVGLKIKKQLKPPPRKGQGDSSRDQTWSPIVGGHVIRHWKGSLTLPETNIAPENRPPQ